MEENGPIVIKIPEIIALIVHQVDSEEQLKLMLVSKYFFHSVGPMVWRSVPRLDVVMGLIEGAKAESRAIENFPGYKPRRYEIVVTLPPNLDLSRYDIYAPWIQDLEIFGTGTQRVINLDRFLALFGNNPLLPNLQRLTAYTTVPVSGNENEIMNLVNMFLCPSLTDLRTILQDKDEDGTLQTSSFRLPASTVPMFLHRIKSTCPQIQVLEFYPEYALPGSGSERYMPNSQCLSTLSSFLGLRFFSSTTYVLERATLAILGELPYLESLGIRGSPTERSLLDKQVPIPETWFPVLKSLQLYDVHHEDIQVLWNQPTIVKNLVSAVIQIDHLTPRDPPDDMLHGQNWIGPFLAALPRLSPCLQDLMFCMGDESGRVEIPRESWGFISRGDMSPGDAYTMSLWPDLGDYSD